jgi:hypothetical protein
MGTLPSEVSTAILACDMALAVLGLEFSHFSVPMS